MQMDEQDRIYRKAVQANEAICNLADDVWLFITTRISRYVKRSQFDFDEHLLVLEQAAKLVATVAAEQAQASQADELRAALEQIEKNSERASDGRRANNSRRNNGVFE
jgi:hypothetical protein